MTQIDIKTANNFVEDLTKDFWSIVSKRYVSRYCHPDLVGYYQGKVYSNADQLERMANNVDAYQDREVKDIVTSVSGNRIVCDYVLVGKDTRNNKDVAFPLSEVYVMDKGRVKEALILGDLSFAYKYSGRKEEENERSQHLTEGKKIIKLQDQLARQYANVLSRRQIQCLAYSVFGYTAKEIAGELELSFRTVESYLNSVKSKCDCPNKNHLMRKLKLVDIDHM